MTSTLYNNFDHLQEASQFGVSIGNMGGAPFRVPQGRNHIPQGQQPRIYSHTFLQLLACCPCTAISCMIELIKVKNPTCLENKFRTEEPFLGGRWVVGCRVSGAHRVAENGCEAGCID